MRMMDKLPKGSVLYGKFKEDGIKVVTHVIMHEGRSAWHIQAKGSGNKHCKKVIPLEYEPGWGYDISDVERLERETAQILKEIKEEE